MSQYLVAWTRMNEVIYGERQINSVSAPRRAGGRATDDGHGRLPAMNERRHLNLVTAAAPPADYQLLLVSPGAPPRLRPTVLGDAESPHPTTHIFLPSQNFKKNI